MKRVINGKKYDTETATPIASDSYSYPGDFAYWSEELYKTKNGNYFLYGEGGPMTSYARSVGNNTVSGGERIIPLTREEAFKWCQEHNCVEEIEQEFADLVEEG